MHRAQRTRGTRQSPLSPGFRLMPRPAACALTMQQRLIRALLSSLRFDKPDSSQLRALDDAEWRAMLGLTDRLHMTLALAHRCRDDMPAWVRERVDRNIAGNKLKSERSREEYRRIAAALERAGIEWVVLKGFTHATPLRPQGDIDLLCTPESAEAAQKVVIGLGYEPITEPGEFAADHLPLLIRRTGWRWREDYFDPDHPPAVEIHFRCWDPATERLPIDGPEEFWSRRVIERRDGFCFPAFDPLDRIAYAALHALRHLLRGDLLLWHIYELAFCSADNSAQCNKPFPEVDSSLWGGPPGPRRTPSSGVFGCDDLAEADEGVGRGRGRPPHKDLAASGKLVCSDLSGGSARYPDAMRRLVSIPLRLAHLWFGSPRDEMPLPAAVERWFDLYAREPIGPALFPAKTELWLHTSLLESRADILQVMRRKLLPIRKRRLIEAPHLRDSEVTSKVRVERAVRTAQFLAARAVHHARALPVAAAQGVLWYSRSRGFNPGFFRFLAAASLFNFGMTIFFLLYNLYLLKLGFHEDFLGLVAGAMTAGSIAGTIPGGYFTSRFGLKRALVFAFSAAPLVCVVRALAISPAALLTAAFVGGFLMSIYAVALTPAVAQLAPEKVRPLAFSLSCSLGIGMGVVGSAIGGELPDRIGGLAPTLLAASAIAALGALAAMRLPLAKPDVRARHIYPRDPVIMRYLAALGLWSLATGALNPFFNVYFSTQLHAPLSSIGMVFSSGQLVQTLAVLAAPLVLRRLGMPSGIMAMQIATGLSLALLATSPPLAGAAALYAAYMAFQYMSEPGMFTFLMDRAREEERGGAAALNMLVLFAGQAIAASISGIALRRFGYPVVLVAAALLAIVAGFCFRLAMRVRAAEPAESQPEQGGAEGLAVHQRL